MIVDPAARTVTYTLVELEEVRKHLNAAVATLIDRRDSVGMSVVIDHVTPALQALGLPRDQRPEGR